MGVYFSGGVAVTNSGPVPISMGGTGETTAVSALNALLPLQTSQSGKVLTTDGTNVSWQAAGGSTAPVDANTLTGTTLASGVTASSLTSVGTLIGLNINGNITATGKLTTSAIKETDSGDVAVGGMTPSVGLNTNYKHIELGAKGTALFFETGSTQGVYLSNNIYISESGPTFGDLMSSGLIYSQSSGSHAFLITAGIPLPGGEPAVLESKLIIDQSAVNVYADFTATGITKSTAYQETKVAMAANDVDLSTANYFTKTIAGATTLTVSNVPSSGTVASFILDLTNGGSAAITWWEGVKWAGGTAPTLTAAGCDVLGFFTYDGGTTWSGLVLGKDMK